MPDQINTGVPPAGIDPNVDLSQLQNLTEHEIRQFQANSNGINPTIPPLPQQQQPQQPQPQQQQPQQQQPQQDIQDPQKVFALYKEYLGLANKLEKENKALKQQLSGVLNGNGNGNGNAYNNGYQQVPNQQQLNQKQSLEETIAELQKQKTELEIHSLGKKGEWDKIAQIQLNQQKQDFTKQISSINSEAEKLRQERDRLSAQLQQSLQANDRYTRKQIALNEFIQAGGDPQAFEYVWAVDLEPQTRLNSDGKLQAYNPTSQTFVTDDSGRNPLLVNSLIEKLKKESQARFFASSSQLQGFGLQNQGFGYNPNNRQPTLPDTSRPMNVSPRIMTDRVYQRQVTDQLGGANIYELLTLGKLVIDEQIE